MQVDRNGITFNGWHYYDEALCDIKDYVIGKYSLSDFSQIYCFYKNQFHCVAKPIEKVHPMAFESEFPKDLEAVKRIGALKNRTRRTAKNLLTLIESGKSIDWERSRSPEVTEVVKAIGDKRKPTKRISPFPDKEDDAIGEASAEVVKDEIIVDLESGIGGHTIFVDLRTGLSRPGDGTIFKNAFEYYDWYRAKEESSPGILNDKDWQWIREYEVSEEWEDYYGRSKYTRMARATSDSGNSNLESNDQEVQK
jgi:hypothetical protein